MERDPKDILRHFTRLCNTDSGHLQHHLAANGVLEWFGRTVRGRTNIIPYYRFDLCQQYEHDFDKAERCTAFECKPSHMQTQTIAAIDKVHAPHTTIPTIDNDAPSTPIQRIATPTLPKVGKERIFITTPEISPSSSSSTAIPHDNFTPPQNIIKHQKSEEDDSPPIKRPKFAESVGGAGDAFLYKRGQRKESGCDTTWQQTTGPEDGQGDDGTPTFPTTTQHSRAETQSDTGYSDLKYIESTGFLRTRPKHRGVGHSDISSESHRTSPISSSSSSNDLNSTTHVRKTKLKLSYRIRVHDNQLQFALIIYEHLSRNMTLRRNLLTEFQQTNDDSDAASPHTSANTKRFVSPSPAKRPVKSLKRSLRLF